MNNYKNVTNNYMPTNLNNLEEMDKFLETIQPSKIELIRNRQFEQTNYNQ